MQSLEVCFQPGPAEAIPVEIFQIILLLNEVEYGMKILQFAFGISYVIGCFDILYDDTQSQSDADNDPDQDSDDRPH